MRKYIQVFRASDGAHLLGPDWRPAEKATPELLARLQAQAESEAGEPAVVYLVDEDQAPLTVGQAALAGRVVATVEEGAVVAVELVPLPLVYLHLAFTGGDGEDPPGIKNDGLDALGFTATLRAGADPVSPVIPVSAAWRITVRDDLGQVYDVVRVVMTDGVVSASYTTSARPALCRLLESDLGPVEPGDGRAYQVRLVGPAEFKVFREL